MAKNDNAHSMRIVESIRTVVNEDEARNFEESLPLSKSANINKKFEWAKQMCDYLEERYDVDTIMKIRERCICNDGKSTAIKMSKYIRQTQSISEFVEIFNENESFASLEYINERNILFCYPQCYCSCVKRINEPLPETWCYCTLGYAKSLFKEVFHKDVVVHLVESIKMGGKRCAVSVEW